MEPREFPRVQLVVTSVTACIEPRSVAGSHWRHWRDRFFVLSGQSRQRSIVELVNALQDLPRLRLSTRDGLISVPSRLHLL
jgi:hypothetical protein